MVVGHVSRPCCLRFHRAVQVPCLLVCFAKRSLLFSCGKSAESKSRRAAWRRRREASPVTLHLCEWHRRSGWLSGGAAAERRCANPRLSLLKFYAGKFLSAEMSADADGCGGITPNIDGRSKVQPCKNSASREPHHRVH